MSVGVIKLRFVTGNDWMSQWIRAAENFWASHVEALMPDGSGYIGAHADGGVQIRPVGYDKDSLKRELIVELRTTVAIAELFYKNLKKHVGEPYDFQSIIGFVTRLNLHDRSHVICSALQALELEECGYFAFPLSRPPHEISPADLLLILSGQVPIKDGGR